jgi:hypothetical protein
MRDKVIACDLFFFQELPGHSSRLCDGVMNGSVVSGNVKVSWRTHCRNLQHVCIPSGVEQPARPIRMDFRHGCVYAVAESNLNDRIRHPELRCELSVGNLELHGACHPGFFEKAVATETGGTEDIVGQQAVYFA